MSYCEHVTEVGLNSTVKCGLGLFGGHPKLKHCEGCRHADRGKLAKRLARSVAAPRVHPVIPRKIHFVWIGPPMPQWMERVIERWRDTHLGYEVFVHDEKVLLPELEATYKKMWRLDMRSDLLRVSALVRHGGWYIDTDMIPIRTLDAIYLDGHMLSPFVIAAFGPGQPLAPGLMGAAKDSMVLAAWRKRLAAGELAAKGRRGDSVGPWLVTEVVESMQHAASIIPRNRWIHLGRVGAGGREVALAQAALEGKVTRATMRRWVPCGCHEAMPYVVHASMHGGDTPKAGFVAPKRAVALLIASAAERVGGALLDAAAMHGVNLLVRDVKEVNYVKEFRQHRNVITWGMRRPGSWYRQGGRNVLYVENGLFSQGDGFYMDDAGYFAESSICDCVDSKAALSESELVRVRAIGRKHFGWSPLEGGDPNGPVLVALQCENDAPCKFHFPMAKGKESRMGVLMDWCREHLAGHEVIVRAHPKFKGEAAAVAGKMLDGWVWDDMRSPYERLKGCKALVTVNSTLATEAQWLGIPVITLGGGTFDGWNVTWDASVVEARGLDDVVSRRVAMGRIGWYLAEVMRHQISYASTAEEIAAHPIFARWARRAAADA